MVLPIRENLSLTEEIEVIDAADLPSRTYKLDIENGRCGGFIEGLESMEQAIFKIINTVRYKHLIYSDDYGFENMIGEDELYVRGDLPRRIQEALLQDPRITSIADFNLDMINKESALVDCTVHTVYGDVNLLKEVIFSA